MNVGGLYSGETFNAMIQNNPVSSLKAVILGVSRGQRRLDGNESVPSGLSSRSGEPSSLQWIVSALKSHGVDEIIYLGGYHIEKILEAYPDINVKFFRGWKDNGEALALAEVLQATSSNTLIIHSQTLILPSALSLIFASVASMKDKSIVVSGQKTTSSASYPLGMLYIPLPCAPNVCNIAKNLVQNNPRANLVDLIALIDPISTVDAQSCAASLSDSESLSRLLFRGKAKTLEQLTGVVRGAIFPRQRRYKVEQWLNNRKYVIDDIASRFPNGQIVARSSTASEDSTVSSGAGKFHSQLDVDPTNSEALEQAIDNVVKSYSRDKRSLHHHDEILIQAQVGNLRHSGVVLTRDPATGAPYYVINYESGSGRSDVVTSGGAGELKTIFVSWDTSVNHLGDDIVSIVALANELREITGDDALDFEFGCDNYGRLFLFQVRPLTIPIVRKSLFDQDLVGIREAAAKQFEASVGSHLSLVGRRSVFANMSDWNPAEMIGTEPAPLSLSLYQYLIGDWTWSFARSCIGYRDITPEPLIYSFGGRPYVDVRASLNSFLPNGLDDKVGQLWVDDCLSRLSKNPQSQDKLEFEITPTCLAFDWPTHALRMHHAGLSEDEISTYKNLLGHLTSQIVSGEIYPVSEQMILVSDLTNFLTDWKKRDMSSVTSAAQGVQMLLSRCTRMGIVPFAILARYGFIAMSLLRSLLEIDILTSDEYDLILRGIPTVASKFTKDISSFFDGNITLTELLSIYGHLRPHSYDITSLSYSQQPQMLLSGRSYSVCDQVNWSDIEALFASKQTVIQQSLSELGLSVSVHQLLEFIKSAISGRERAKFEFMKVVDASLEGISTFAGLMGLSKEDVSFLPISEILRYAHDSPSGASSSRLSRVIEYRKKRQQLTRALRLPDVISSTNAFNAYEQLPCKPNFVTRSTITASLVVVDEFHDNLNLSGMIVAIRAADPGFDWIFSHNIAGLITEYGGAASHMAIRSAEFGIPAAIGCGTKLFESLTSANCLELDCANERILPR